jgi:hypothetical protein
MKLRKVSTESLIEMDDSLFMSEKQAKEYEVLDAMLL